MMGYYVILLFQLLTVTATVYFLQTEHFISLDILLYRMSKSTYFVYSTAFCTKISSVFPVFCFIIIIIIEFVCTAWRTCEEIICKLQHESVAPPICTFVGHTALSFIVNTV